VHGTAQTHTSVPTVARAYGEAQQRMAQQLRLKRLHRRARRHAHGAYTYLAPPHLSSAHTHLTPARPSRHSAHAEGLETPLPSNSPHDHMILRVDRGAHTGGGDWLELDICAGMQAT
jgi:hypothetical protein